MLYFSPVRFALQLFHPLLVLVLAGANGLSLATAQAPDLLPIRIGKGFGYGNAAANLTLTGPYDDAMPFQRGRAVVKKAGSYGLIDTQGAWILEPQYQEIVVGKLLRLRKADRWALADMDGCLTTAFDFQAIHELKNGHFLLDRGGLKGMARPDGWLVVPCAFDMVTQLRDDQGNHVDLYAV